MPKLDKCLAVVAWVAAVAGSACDLPTGVDGGSGGGGSIFDDPGEGKVAAEPADLAKSACGSVGVEGECTADGKVRKCLEPTGYGEPKVVTYGCGKFASCTVSDGAASCTDQKGKCTPEDTRCTDATTLEYCDNDGAWQSVDCGSPCKSAAISSFCDAGTGKDLYTVTVQYEAVGPNDSMTDWSTAAATVAAQGVLALAFDTAGEGTIIDSAIADSGGTVALDLSGAKGDVTIAIVAARLGDDKNKLDYIIAQPDVGDGKQDTDLAAPKGADAKPWSWQIDPKKSPSGSTVVVKRSQGSGVLRVFDILRFAHAKANATLAGATLPLVVWMRPNTTWDCGACFNDWPTAVSSFDVLAQAWLPMDAKDQSYWADPVTAHELGHWVMAAFSTSPNEGGSHCLGVPTFPGQAWSEGWATGFSSIIRDNPLYYDKQQGSFFWVDLAGQKYESGKFLVKPQAKLGLIQFEDENHVASLLWHLAQNPAIGPTKTLFAVSSTRLQVEAGKRGYARRTWKMANCKASDAVNTGKAAPFLADYLDALRCEGTAAAEVDAVTKPATQFPYPADAPLCD